VKEKDIQIWDTAMSPPKRRAAWTGHEGKIRAIASRSDGTCLVSSALKDIRFWDISGATPKETRTVKRIVAEELESADVLSPDGRFLVAVARGRTAPSWLWRLDKDGERPLALPRIGD